MGLWLLHHWRSTIMKHWLNTFFFSIIHQRQTIKPHIKSLLLLQSDIKTSKSYSPWPLTSSCHKGSQMTYLPEFILESVLLLMFLLINLIPEVGHQQKILVIFCLLNSSKTINSLSICYTWDSTESIIVIRVLEKKGDPIYKKMLH